MKLSEAIKHRRKELGLTLEEVAEMCGVTRSAVCKWENGNVSSIKADMCVKLAAALKCEPIEFFQDDIEKLGSYKKEKEPQITQKQDAILERIKKLNPEQVKQVGQYIEFIISQRGDDSD